MTFMQSDKLNFIDLFAGASGMSEGFIKAGFNPIAHVEMNKEACFTIKTRTAFHYLKENGKENEYNDYLKGVITRDELYKKIPINLLDSIYNIEINDTSIKPIFKKIKECLKNQSIDLIIGGPPCQAYSLIVRHQDVHSIWQIFKGI
jgi:DNA (cytosine-5)-methyltransferase 1